LVKSGKEKSLETFEQIKEKIAEQNLSTADILDAIKAKTAKAPTVDVTADDIEDAVVVSEDIEIDIDSVVVVEPTVEEVTEAPTNDSEESHNL
jgi:hypothetical protein